MTRSGKDTIPKGYDNYYNLYYDGLTDLEYVRLNPEALKIIAERYKLDERYRDYNINIIIEDYKYDFIDEHYNIIEKHAKSLQDGETRGVVCVQKSWDEEGIFHVKPYMLTKVFDKVILIDFEGNLKDVPQYVDIVKEVPNYRQLQRDLNSCSVFSIDIIKNAFLDCEFMKQARTIEFQSSLLTKDVKETIGQGREYIFRLDEEQKAKYVHDVSQKDIQPFSANLKAFYKGHFYARKLNPDHMDLIDKKSREVVLKIDGIRHRIKEEKALQARSVQEEKNVSFDDFDELDLPDNSVQEAKKNPLQSVARGSKF